MIRSSVQWPAAARMRRHAVDIGCDHPGYAAEGTVVWTARNVTRQTLERGEDGVTVFKERKLEACGGVKQPIVHVMGYFVSILRERIANFEAPPPVLAPGTVAPPPEIGASAIGVSINDLRKNLRGPYVH